MGSVRVTMRWVLIVVLALFRVGAASGQGSDFAAKFAVVMIDAETEAKLGPFPYDRAVMARAVQACAQAGAKAVALKFFFDLPKTSSGDRALADAMTQIPVLLQARLEPQSGTTAALPARFRLPAALAAAEQGERGWMPLPLLLERASACGFVDFNSRRVPLVERYQGQNYRSFIVCCLEAALGEAAVFAPGRVTFGTGGSGGGGGSGSGRALRLDERNVFQATFRPRSWQAISFARLLAGEVRKEELAGRVVIIGWDSPRTDQIEGMGMHAFFVQALAAAWEGVEGR